MRASLLFLPRLASGWLRRAFRVVRLHVESSVKVSKDETDTLITRLKKTSSTNLPKQINSGDEKKIGNLKARNSARQTLKDLPQLLETGKEHWFDSEVEGLGAPIKKSSTTYHRLQAYIATQVEKKHDIDRRDDSGIYRAVT